MYNLQHIKILAEQKKVTLKEIIIYCGVSEAGFHKSIKTQSMGIQTINKIADFFGVSISELIGDDAFVENKGNDVNVENVGIYKKLVTTQEGLIDKQEKLYNSSVKEIQDLKKQVEKLKNDLEISRGYSMAAEPPVKLIKK